MKTEVHCPFDFQQELRREANLSSLPLYSEPAGADVAELIDEAFANGVLSECLPPNPETLQVTVVPQWLTEPIVGSLNITLRARVNGLCYEHQQMFRTGRWYREAQQRMLAYRGDDTLGEKETAYSMLLAFSASHPEPLKLPPLQAPPITDQELSDCGVQTLVAGTLLPDRPVLVSQQFGADAIRRCKEADTNETGGALLGKLIRLKKPLPSTTTRIVTVLSASVDDHRHVGQELSLAFSPEALAEAAQIADLRGLGETVQTVYHTHGWKNSCGRCNESPDCPLAECNPSLQDYKLLETLFPSKTTLMPIAGRKLGEPVHGPVLQIHAWRGGQMRPIPWAQYTD
jgi:hypothetical protein